MTRLFTTGFDSGLGSDLIDGHGDFGSIAIDTSAPITGAGSCMATGGGVCTWGMSTGVVENNGLYLRARFKVDVLPSTAAVDIMMLRNGVNERYTARLTSGGKIRLWNAETSTQVGSDSSATIATGTVYRLELFGDATADTCELRLDGVSVASGSSGVTGPLNQILLGWRQDPGTSSMHIWFDDLALNDGATATSQNTWPGDGRVRLAMPISDNAGGTGWTLGNGTALGGGGWSRVNGNTATAPSAPEGVADLSGAPADAQQIRNAAASANSNYDVNLTTYTNLGVLSGDTINVVVPVVVTAAPVSTSAKQGTVGVSSNPTITNVALAAGGTSGAFWSGTAGGTYATGWKVSQGTTTYAPSPTLGSSPVMRITQVTSSTRIAMVCWMGMYVDWTPAAIVATPGVATLTLATFAPVIKIAVVPATASLTLSTFAPTVTTSANQTLVPGVATLATVTFAPVIKLVVVPATASLTLSTFAPAVTASNHQLVSPATATLTTATFAPGVNLKVIPATASLTTATFAPVATVGGNQVVTPGVATLTTTGLAPTVTASNHITVTPAVAALVTATFAPTARLAINAVPATAALTLTTFAPAVNLVVTPGVASLTLTRFAPTVTATDHKVLIPVTATLSIAAFAPNVAATAHRFVTPATAALALSAYAPAIDVALVPAWFVVADTGTVGHGRPLWRNA